MLHQKACKAFGLFAHHRRPFALPKYRLPLVTGREEVGANLQEAQRDLYRGRIRCQYPIAECRIRPTGKAEQIVVRMKLLTRM